MGKEISSKYFKDLKSAAVIVAHPDDEILWAGGTILLNPLINWTVMTITRQSDPDRCEKFYKAMRTINASAIMADLDDGPDQKPLEISQIEKTITQQLPDTLYDIIITHHFKGEYTRHLRHEETAQAVTNLWKKDILHARQLWHFAYEDGQKNYYPRPIEEADIIIKLPYNIWQKKYDLITKTYGFHQGSFEAETTPEREAFWVSK